ncbi:unnamed protein product [Angiostrongylus costaricensis]|uniref:Spaetzle domain-containing protein n=1 Tax=Angiostrongylus costaricensis TaxID=334426 RepID=A0A158PLZ1_ANGCS|nr:unnamed protein product [Angiostrongylus costaricensis]
MEPSSQFTHKAECPRYNSGYICRDMRLPENRHLGEFVLSEVRQVCKSYYMNEFARTLNNAAVCRCEENIASSSSSTFPVSDASPTDGIRAKDYSSGFFHNNSYVANKAIGGEVNAGMTSDNQMTSKKLFNTVNVGRTNTLLKADSTKKLRRYAHVVDNKVGSLFFEKSLV